MGKKYDFDYIIIGSGPAGRTAATNLAKAKKKIAIIESGTFGGSDLNSRDIPYSVSLDFAHNYHKLHSHPAMSSTDLHFNFPTLISKQNYASRLVNSGTKPLEDLGITCISGHAHFLSTNSIAVGNNQFTAKSFIIATGSKLKTGEISGLDTINYLTPDTAIKVSRLPKCVLIVGGGSTGCEIASYFASLGTKVLIMERASRILPREDKEASTAVADYLTHKLGVMIVPNSRVVALEQDDISKRVIFTTNGQEKLVRIDCVILATGSEPALDLGLENAGVKYKKAGIPVDRFFQTSSKNIYAIGDCIGRADSSTELAEYEASLLTTNLINKTKATANYNGFIRSVNTFPEVAVVGMNDKDALSRDKKLKKSIVYLNELPFSKVSGLDSGFVKILAESEHIVGATIVAPHASLLIEELALAVRHRISLASIASTPHPTNSFSAAIKLAAKKLLK